MRLNKTEFDEGNLIKEQEKAVGDMAEREVYDVLPFPIYVFSSSQTTCGPMPNKLVPAVLQLLRRQKLTENGKTIQALLTIKTEI